MSTTSDGPLASGGGPKRVRRRQTGVRALMVLVACCGAILWAWRHLSENYDPVLVEARSIQERAIGALRSGEPSERLEAIRRLERLSFGDSSVAIHPLIGALDDPVVAVRVAAADALGSTASGPMKSGPSEEARQAAATALVERLADPEAAFRVADVRSLGSIILGLSKSGAGGAVFRASTTAVLRCMKDQEPAVRSASATCLGPFASPASPAAKTPSIDHQAVMDALVEMLGDRDAGARLAAIHALASQSWNSAPPTALIKALKDESADNRSAVVIGLTPFRTGLNPWTPSLLELAEHDPDPDVRQRCFNTLGHAFKPPAVTAAVVPVLIASLKSKDERVRSQAASLLGEFSTDALGAVPELLRVLNEPHDPETATFRLPALGAAEPACEAARALGRIAPGTAAAKEVVAALVEFARSGPLMRRGWAAYALSEFGTAAEEAVPALVKIVDDAPLDDKFNREASVVLALSKIAPGTPSAGRAVATILPGLQSKLWVSQLRALDALGRFGPAAAEAVPRIRALTDDPNTRVRDAATKALTAIEDEQAP